MFSSRPLALPSTVFLPHGRRAVRGPLLYFVLASALHTETSEPMVLYRAVDPDDTARTRNPYNMVLVRPSDMGRERVEVDRRQAERFQRVEKSVSETCFRADAVFTSAPNRSIHIVTRLFHSLHLPRYALYRSER